MLTDIKLSKAQLTKIIQSGGFLANMMSDLGKFGKLLGKKPLTNAAFPFAKDVLFGLVSNIASNATSNEINIF